MSPSLKRNGYCWGMVGVNGAKTRAHVVSLGRGHRSLSQEKNVNDPASAPPTLEWGGGSGQ